MRKGQIYKALSDAFGHLKCIVFARCGEYCSKFFATVPNHGIVGPAKCKLEASGHGLETVVACLVTVCVVVSLETVYVDHQ